MSENFISTRSTNTTVSSKVCGLHRSMKEKVVLFVMV